VITRPSLRMQAARRRPYDRPGLPGSRAA
jgi:hypothetical protein